MKLDQILYKTLRYIALAAIIYLLLRYFPKLNIKPVQAIIISLIVILVCLILEQVYKRLINTKYDRVTQTNDNNTCGSSCKVEPFDKLEDNNLIMEENIQNILNQLDQLESSGTDPLKVEKLREEVIQLQENVTSSPNEEAMEMIEKFTNKIDLHKNEPFNSKIKNNKKTCRVVCDNGDSTNGATKNSVLVEEEENIPKKNINRSVKNDVVEEELEPKRAKANVNYNVEEEKLEPKRAKANVNYNVEEEKLEPEIGIKSNSNVEEGKPERAIKGNCIERNNRNELNKLGKESTNDDRYYWGTRYGNQGYDNKYGFGGMFYDENPFYNRFRNNDGNNIRNVGENRGYDGSRKLREEQYVKKRKEAIEEQAHSTDGWDQPYQEVGDKSEVNRTFESKRPIEGTLDDELPYSDYNHLPVAAGYKSHDYEYGYNFLPPERWAPQPNRPPICVTEKRAPVNPVFTQGAPTDVKEFHASRRITPPDLINTSYIDEKLNAGR